MAVLPIHKYFSLNGELKSIDQFVASENEGGVYEVMRVVNHIPLFLEDHMARFYRSAKIAGKNIIYSTDQIRTYLNDLIQGNKVQNGNILLSCKINLKIFFIAHFYPDENMYKEGVNCGLLNAVRNNPNAKVFQTEVRIRANELIGKEKYYEVLLVDHSGLITEGSRSNVFFIKGNRLVTPPAGKVLIGITRLKTIECAGILGIDVIEEEIHLSQLGSFDAVFITGTSPKILPVKQIGETEFDTNNGVLRNLMTQYDLLVEEYLDSKGIKNLRGT